MEKKSGIAGLFTLVLALAYFLLCAPTPMPRAEAANGVFGWKAPLAEIEVPSDWIYWQGAAPPDEETAAAFFRAAGHGGTAPEGWQHLAFPSPPTLAADTRYVWLATRLPEDGKSGMALFFTTTNQAVRVWIDGKLIYEYGSMEDGTYNYGERWHLVPMPEGYAGKSLVFGLHSFDLTHLGTFRHMYLRDMRTSVSDLFFYDIPFVFGLSLVFMLSAIVGLYGLTLRHRRRAYLFLLLFLLNYGVWMISASNVKSFVLDWAAFWWYLQLPAIYGFPVFAFLFFAELFPVKPRRTMRLLALPFVLLLFVSLLGEIIFSRGMIFYNMALYYPLVAILAPWAGWLLWCEAKNGNAYCRIALVPVFVVCPLGLFDGLWFYYRLFSWNMYLTPFALLSLVFLILSIIRMRIRDEVRSEALQASLEHEIMEAKERAQIDPLTKCFNRYKFPSSFCEWVQVAERTDGSLALLMLDIDFFKKINDSYGHDEGDRVLIRLAQELRGVLDRRHILFRWGGEEFIILCLHYTLQEAAEFADGLREKIAAAPICRYQSIQCSIGVAMWHGAARDTSAAFLKRADDALYQAKSHGRNRVEREGPGSLERSLAVTQGAESVELRKKKEAGKKDMGEE